jgi:hypothetical protein
VSIDRGGQFALQANAAHYGAPWVGRVLKMEDQRMAIADQRFAADRKLTRSDFAQLAAELAVPPLRARKIGFVAAHQATAAQRVETHWNGKETANTAQAGDWIVTNLSPQHAPLIDGHGRQNTYVIKAARFADLYEPAGAEIALGPVYRAIAVVHALRLPGGFDIVAPWGERQQIPNGYLILNGEEVYGNQAETFEATYEVLTA